MNVNERPIHQALFSDCERLNALPLAQKLLETAIEQGACYEQFISAVKLAEFSLKIRIDKNPLLSQPISSFVDNAEAAIKPL